MGLCYEHSDQSISLTFFTPLEELLRIYLHYLARSRNSLHYSAFLIIVPDLLEGISLTNSCVVSFSQERFTIANNRIGDQSSISGILGHSFLRAKEWIFGKSSIASKWLQSRKFVSRLQASRASVLAWSLYSVQSLLYIKMTLANGSKQLVEQAASASQQRENSRATLLLLTST